jgi:molecular chaperone DnaK
MSDPLVIGIDLGTTFSAVASIDRHGQPRVLPNPAGKRTTPSVVYFEEGSGVVVGEMARNQTLAEPTRTVQFIKREMGDSSYQVSIDGVDYVPEAISALILKQLRSDAEAKLGGEIRDAVITVPAYFKDSQRQATQKAGDIAGLNVVAMINEPTAAAVAYGLTRVEDSRNVLVYDFGGGTFDVTILRIEGNEFTVITTDGASRLGGVDVDERLADHLAEQFLSHHGVDLRAEATSKLDLWQRAETAKIDLSTRQSVKVPLSAGAQAMRVDIDRETFNELIAPLLTQTEQCMERALAAAGLDWNAIDTVLPVGGSSRMACVKELIQRVTGKEPSTDVNPDECVVLGAAMRAGLELKETAGSNARPPDERPPGVEEVGIVINDVAPHSLGVRAVNTAGEPVNSIIIPRFTQLPCERKRTYATRADNQQVIEIEILQGEDPDPFSIEVESIGRVRVSDLPEKPAGDVIVAISLRYDADGVVEVLAEELADGRVVREQLLRKSGELDSETTESIRSQVDTLTGEQQAPTGEPSGDPDADVPLASEADGERRGKLEGDASEPAPDREAAPPEPAETASASDLYASLELARGASEAEIEAALERTQTELDALRKARAGGDPDGADESSIAAQLAQLEEARSILLDPEARADYDALGDNHDDPARRKPEEEEEEEEQQQEETGEDSRD